MRTVLREALREALREDLREDLREALREALCEPLREALREALRKIRLSGERCFVLHLRVSSNGDSSDAVFGVARLIRLLGRQ